MKRLLPLFLLILAGCASSTTPQNTTKLAQLEQSANHQGLVAFYKQQIELNPYDFEAHNQLAENYFKLDDLESAHFYLQRVIEHDAATAKTYYLQGLVFDKKAQFNQSLESFLLANTNGDESGELYFHTGLAYAKLDYFELAIQALNEARVRGYPEQAIKNNLGLIYTQQGRYPKAIEILLPLYQHDPSNDKVKANLAIALIKHGEHQAAAELLGLATPSLELSSQPTLDEPQTLPRYALQFGSYRQRKEAELRKQQLQRLPIELHIQAVDLAERGIWYRVLSDDFEGYSTVTKYLVDNQLTLDGVDYFIQKS